MYPTVPTSAIRWPMEHSAPSHAVDARRDLVPLGGNGFVVDLQRFAHSTIFDLAADKPSRHTRPRCLTPASPRRPAGFRWAPIFDPRAPKMHLFVPVTCALPDSR
jgi:hypothetical protein